MNFNYDNVYVNDTGTVVGPYEHNGPLTTYFDKAYDDLYFGRKTWELSESKLIEDSVNIVVLKSGLTKFDIDLHISGDLLNQIVSTNYAAVSIGIPLAGIYSACATSALGLIIGSNMIESRQIKNCLCSVSSHNCSAEKQFRYPVEYGGPKPKTMTFTCTGGCTALISKDKSKIKIESGTIGKVVDMGVKDVFNMGAVMAPAAADTLYSHLKELKRTPDYYDLILTGDLGVYGRDILKDYMYNEYGIKLNNYDDSATMLYDREEQPVYAGASGPACLPLVTYGYILNKMYKKELKRVLIIAA